MAGDVVRRGLKRDGGSFEHRLAGDGRDSWRVQGKGMGVRGREFAVLLNVHNRLLRGLLVVVVARD